MIHGWCRTLHPHGCIHKAKKYMRFGERRGRVGRAWGRGAGEEGCGRGAVGLKKAMVY